MLLENVFGGVGAQLYRKCGIHCFKIHFLLVIRKEIKGKGGNFSSSDNYWEPVDFRGKTGEAVEGNSSESGNKTRSLFLPLNSYFSFFF
ncbi:hypothetical protein DV515_00011452 [Chloebia gouldiae]|uniref:Uncharacterized protein n=1 Tax=Chloebia gouldiae TaxID=44316 RepID=A0A3L8S733_CHLGU|nr:hypothetical protein DV515_00011452 [Chloebia gouldiae]